MCKLGLFIILTNFHPIRNLISLNTKSLSNNPIARPSTVDLITMPMYPARHEGRPPWRKVRVTGTIAVLPGQRWRSAIKNRRRHKAHGWL